MQVPLHVDAKRHKVIWQVRKQRQNRDLWVDIKKSHIQIIYTGIKRPNIKWHWSSPSLIWPTDKAGVRLKWTWLEEAESCLLNFTAPDCDRADLRYCFAKAQFSPKVLKQQAGILRLNCSGKALCLGEKNAALVRIESWNGEKKRCVFKFNWLNTPRKFTLCLLSHIRTPGQ